MPPQGYIVGGGLVLNYMQSRRGRPTISQFCAQHKVAVAVAWIGFNLWVVPHVAFKEAPCR